MPSELQQNARILVVDDQEPVVESLKRTLRMAGYTNVRSTTDPLLVLAIYDHFQPDLLLLDIHMPHLDGLAVMHQLESRIAKSAFFPVLILTGDVTAESRQAALSLGAKDFLVKPFDPIELRLRVKNLLETRFLYRQLQNRNGALEEAVAERTRDLEEAQLEAVARLAMAAEYRDDETGQHTLRVGRLAALIARNLGLPRGEAGEISQAAPLHDVGKIGIPDSILLKPGKLTAQEYEVMKTHTVIGAHMLGGSRSPLLECGATIALYHHERWDGAGYAHLKADAVPLAARIVAVADTFDAMTHDRRYRKAVPIAAAIAEIHRHREKQFDPAVVEAFLRLRGPELALDLALLGPARFPSSPAPDALSRPPLLETVATP